MKFNANQASDPNELYALSRACMAHYDFLGAAEALQRAHRLDPKNDRILVDLGGAFAKAYDYDAARQWFVEALKVSKQVVPALNAIGHAWLEVRNYEAAQESFERVLRESNQPPLITLIRLAEIYTRRRRIPEAAKVTEQALKMYGGQESAVLARANVHRQAGQFDLAERLYQSLVSRGEGDYMVIAFAGYELAALHDLRGNYDLAMTTLLAAKELLRRHAGPQLKVLRQKQTHLREMEAAADEEKVGSWRKEAATDLQPVRNMALLCGHARSGTTLVEYVIDAHPGVVSAEETMVFHNHAYFPLGQAYDRSAGFVNSLERLPSRTCRQIRAGYFRGVESLLGEPIGDRVLLDKNPANTFDVPAIARIFPENKFIAVIRDPRDVCLSAFMQAVTVLPDTSAWLTLEDTIEHFVRIMSMWSAWKPALGPLAIETRYEDLVQNLEAESKRVLGFLGLNWDERVMRFNEHASGKVVRSPTFAEVTKPLYHSSVGRWKKYEKYFKPHVGKLESLLKKFGYE